MLCGNYYLLRKHRGISLVELTIVVLIFLLIIGVVLTLLATGSSSWQTADARIQLQQELRKCMDATAEELRQAGYSTIAGVPADGNWYNSITFQIPDNVVSGSVVWTSPIQYLLGGLGGRQVLRRQDGVDRVLANEIIFFGVRRQSSNSTIMEILLNADKTTLWGNELNASIGFQVELRN